MSNNQASERPSSSFRAPVRLVPLDGLRGIAALIVFAHHALALLYGPLAGVAEYHWPAYPRLAHSALQHVPVGWMFNGAFAVSFFFVLSGFVLTLAVGAKAETPRIARLMAYRLLRLSPLVVVATLLGFAVYSPCIRSLDMLRCISGNDSHAYISGDLLANHSFLAAFRQMAYGIWRGARPDTLFDPPLWSIGEELKGSLLVYTLLGLFGTKVRSDAKYWVGVPIGLCLMGPSSLCFLAGMYAAEASRDRGTILDISERRLMLALGLVLVWASVHPWDRHLWLPLPFNPPEIVGTLISAAGSVVLVAAGLQLTRLRNSLESGPVRFLGHASYGLYVVHVPILYVLTGPLFRLLHRHMPFHLATLGAAAVCLALSLGLGALLVDYVDIPLSQRSKSWVSRWVSGSNAG